MISLGRQTTRRALVPPLAKRLRHACPAETSLRCTRRIDLNKLSTGPFCLVASEVEELSPSSIRNTFGKAVIPDHARNIQILDSNQAVIVDKPTADIMVEVYALLCNMRVRSLKQLHSLTPAIRTFLSSGYLALSNAKFLLRFPVIARIVNLCSIGKRSERSKAHVNPYLLSARQQRLRFTLTGKQSEPATRLTLDCERFSYALNWSVKFDFNLADFQDPQFISAKNSFQSLTEGDAVVAAIGAESWIARLLLSLDAAKESVKRKGYSLEYILKNADSYLRELFSHGFNAYELAGLIKVGNAFTVNTPSITSLLESSVKKFAAKRKRLFQANGLSFCWVDSKLKRFAYNLFSHAERIPTLRWVLVRPVRLLQQSFGSFCIIAHFLLRGTACDRQLEIEPAPPGAGSFVYFSAQRQLL